MMDVIDNKTPESVLQEVFESQRVYVRKHQGALPENIYLGETEYKMLRDLPQWFLHWDLKNNLFHGMRVFIVRHDSHLTVS